MKPIQHKLSKSLDRIELHALSDWHIGDAHCDYQKINDTVEQIRDKENAYVILAGDILNNATTQSVSDTYMETINPMEQLQTAVDILQPIKDKILCAVSGNHEFRTYKTDGIDLTRLLCRQLGIEEYYRPESAYMFLSFGTKDRHKSAGRRTAYTVYVTHGNRGGRKIGGKANALQDNANICDADIYIIGHTHSPLVFKDRFYRQTIGSGGLESIERVFVNTAASLNYGGYAEKAGYQPPSKSNPVIELNGKKRDIKVRL